MNRQLIQILSENESLSVKQLKKLAIAALLSEGKDNEKTLKKEFKKSLDELIGEGKLSQNEDDTLTIVKETSKEKRKSESKSDLVDTEPEKPSKSKKSKKSEPESESLADKLELWKNGEKVWKEGSLDYDYLSRNPDRITRLFCGNLNRKITEEDLQKFLPGITYIKWITDKQTGAFYGSSFLEMKDPKSAAEAVLRDKAKLLGRPLKLYYCPPKPGDVWPPNRAGGGGGGGGATSNGRLGGAGPGGKLGGPPTREKTPKPAGCVKLFVGNLSYNIDDETMIDFFKDCGEPVGLRWLCHKDSGEFRGSGYIQFATTEEADKAYEKDGRELLGRPIRLDWTD